MRALLRHFFHQDHVIVALMGMCVVGLLVFVTFNVSFLNPVEQMVTNMKFTDIYNKVKNFNSEPDTSRFITIVDMTDVYNRGELATLINDIADLHPKVIGVDVVFEGERDDVLGNTMLEEAVVNHRDLLVFAAKLTDFDQKKKTFKVLNRSYFTDRIDGLKEGFVNLEDDMRNALIRDCRSGMRQDNQEALMPSLPASILHHYGIDVPLRDQPMLIDFSPMIFPTLQWDSLSLHPEMIRNHIILLGAHEQESDMHLTPLDKMSGVELHAYTLQTLMNHRNITDAPLWLDLLATFLACYLLAAFIELSERRSQRNHISALRVFLDESEWLKAGIVVVSIIIATCIMHWVFEQFDIYINALLVLAAMAVIVQCHDTYMALMNALYVNHSNWWWVQHSLAQDDDE